MINPLIEFWKDPVGALAWLGYALLMATIVVVAVPWCVRQSARLLVRYRKNRSGPSWWSFGNRNAGYIPPASWLARLASILLVLTVVAWALGAFVYLIGGA